MAMQQAGATARALHVCPAVAAQTSPASFCATCCACQEYLGHLLLCPAPFLRQGHPRSLWSVGSLEQGVEMRVQRGNRNGQGL